MSPQHVGHAGELPGAGLEGRVPAEILFVSEEGPVLNQPDFTARGALFRVQER